MNPRHQLALSVAIVAVMIFAAWAVLFRRHILAPPVTMPVGPTIPEIGKEFDDGLERFGQLIESTTNSAPANIPPSANITPPPQAASDDVRTLKAPEL